MPAKSLDHRSLAFLFALTITWAAFLGAWQSRAFPIEHVFTTPLAIEAQPLRQPRLSLAYASDVHHSGDQVIVDLQLDNAGLPMQKANITVRYPADLLHFNQATSRIPACSSSLANDTSEAGILHLSCAMSVDSKNTQLTPLFDLTFQAIAAGTNQIEVLQSGSSLQTASQSYPPISHPSLIDILNPS